MDYCSLVPSLRFGLCEIWVSMDRIEIHPDNDNLGSCLQCHLLVFHLTFAEMFNDGIQCGDDDEFKPSRTVVSKLKNK